MPSNNSAARSVLDLPMTRPTETRLGKYGSQFLSESLPEHLRPTVAERELQFAVLWGDDQFLALRSVRPGEAMTAGAGAEAQLPVFHPSFGVSFGLVSPSGSELTIHIPNGVTASVAAPGGKTVPVSGATHVVGLEDRVRLEVGTLQIVARYTRPQKAPVRPGSEGLDLEFLSRLVVLLMTAVVFQRMIAITDFEELVLSEDLVKNKELFAKYVPKTENKEKPKPLDLSGVKEGAKAKDEEGKFGKKEAEKKEAAPSKKGAPVVDVNKREEDRKKVANSGLLKLLGAGAAGAVSDTFGPGGLGTGLNNALGGVNGAAGAGDAQGVGGLGSRGGGTGGGGTGLGIGGLGGKGTGRGRGGSGEFDLGGTGKGTTKFVPGKTTVEGGLTADEVGRIIRRHWNEIKYCYEKELAKDPNLAGKVAVYFEIGPVGDVGSASVRESTLNNANAESCMLDNVRRWKFPAPRGGGVVNVNYPFIFQSQ